MSKILKYELRRLILNKFFIGLLIINGVYAWYVLTTDIIAGIAYTAPFSLWSFGAYLGKVMPLAILTMLFLLTFYYSKKEKQVQMLTTATPVTPARYALIRCLAISVCFIIICALIIALGIYFYIYLFDYWSFGAFILPTLLILLPCFLFSLGAGHLAGRIHPVAIYILMVIMLIIGFAGIGGTFDFFGAGYFSSYPLFLPVEADGEPSFVLGAGFLTARLIYLGVGGFLVIIGISFSRKKARKA